MSPNSMKNKEDLVKLVLLTDSEFSQFTDKKFEIIELHN